MAILKLRVKSKNGGSDTEEHSDADGDVDTGRKIELFELIDGARGWVDDIEKTLVCTDFELLHRLLVHVNRTVDGKFFDARRQWDRASNAGSCSLSGFDDFLSGTVDRTVIKGTQADADFLVFHGGD